MILAELNTGHYRFQVVATTEDQARAALKEAMRVHCAQTGAESDFMMEAAAEWTEFTKTEFNQVLRDGSPIR